jgi:hypothetical protein
VLFDVNLHASGRVTLFLQQLSGLIGKVAGICRHFWTIAGEVDPVRTALQLQSIRQMNALQHHRHL